MALDEKLDRVTRRIGELQHLLGQPGLDPAEMARLGRDLSQLEPVGVAIQAWQQAQAALAQARGMVADAAEDPDLRALAAEEIPLLQQDLQRMEQDLKRALLPRDADDERNAILEVRAGTGGDEAALFAAELFAMYRRFAQAQGWRWETLDIAETDLGGLKEASGVISGEGVFARLKFESGVHRVQRVPKTEAGGRIHTSAATVAVLPEVEAVDVALNESDLKIDTYRSSGAGGQHVNTTDSAVRITHLPTGIVVQCQDERSQIKNRAKAMKLLLARLYDQSLSARDQARAETRRRLVGRGDRSERIRTYNFPQGRVTDHRINLTLYEIDQVMAGTGLARLVEALMAEDEADRLAELEAS